MMSAAAPSLATASACLSVSLVVAEMRPGSAGSSPVRPVEQPPEIGPERLVVGQGQGGAERLDALAVRLDPGGVHAVERSAAHQADRAHVHLPAGL